MSLIQENRRARRRAESRLFEAIEAADAGELRLARELVQRAATPRRARPATIESERAWIRSASQGEIHGRAERTIRDDRDNG